MVLAPEHPMHLRPGSPLPEDDEDDAPEVEPEFCRDHRIETDSYGFRACLTCRLTK